MIDSASSLGTSVNRSLVDAALPSPVSPQSLSVGVGDEVRLGPGFMFWNVGVSLTEKGLAQVHAVVDAVLRGIEVRA